MIPVCAAGPWKSWPANDPPTGKVLLVRNSLGHLYCAIWQPQCQVWLDEAPQDVWLHWERNESRGILSQIVAFAEIDIPCTQ